MSTHPNNRIEALRYRLELFVDGSDRTADFLRTLARELGEIFPGDPLVEEFLTSCEVYGDPAAAFHRSEEEMVTECARLRRHLPGIGALRSR